MSVAAPPEATGGAVPAFTALPPAPVGESRRTLLARFDADVLLRSQRVDLREHFGDASIGPFQVQRAELATGAIALLVSRADESDPLVLVVDRDRLEWEKRRPTAGMVTPALHMALAPRPDGGAVVFVWVAKLRTVAARMWADDGNAFGDFEVFKPEACDALSAAYVAAGGWIVACSAPTGTRAARLREDATVAWTPDGAPLGSAGSVGPATLAIDSSSSFALIERVAAVGGDRLLAFRYDLGARPLWPLPIDLGRAAISATGRVDTAVVGDGVVRVTLRAPAAGAPGSFAEITASGEVRRVAR